jgi:protein involved in polysaccharide export with SLBB domain
MRSRLAAAALLSCLLFAACPRTTQPGPATLPTADDPLATTAPAPANQGEGVLGPTDVIEIRVFREDDLTGEYEVEADGTINFPLVGSVAIAGLSPTAASEVLAQALEQGYLREANVTIRVLEYNSRQVDVLGEVQQPGSFPYSDGMTIIQAITLAGGLAETGAPNRTTVTRTVDGQQVVIQVPLGDIQQGRATNVPLLPEDLVFVPKSPI